MRRTDVHVLRGLESILNPENIKPGIDLKQLEQSMISNGLIQQTSKDTVSSFNDELQSVLKPLGLSMNENSNVRDTRESKRKEEEHPSSIMNSYDDQDDKRDDKREDDSHNDRAISYSDNHDDEEDEDKPLFSKAPSLGFNNDMKQVDNLADRTAEQKRREHIESIVSNKEDFSLETEKKEDLKAAMLNDIDSLIGILVGMEIDLTRIPKVDNASSYEEISSVLRMLRRKNDHASYCSLADEVFLFGAHLLEELFDGKRTWFERYQPDLTGWHNNVNVKLHRMRYDTSQLVSTIMQEYNIGPGTRILLELIPNMVLYSKMRKDQHDQPSLYNDDEITKASDRIRHNS
jgi:hypothetical protein